MALDGGLNMELNALIDSLSSSKQNIPDEIDILELRRNSVDDSLRRMRKWLKLGGDCCEKNFDRGNWTTYDDRTLVRLPQGAHAVLYHASGAFKLSSGLPTMEYLFKETSPKATLTSYTEKVMKEFGLKDSLARNETLTFERLWQIKAAGTDRSGKPTEAVLCRAVGAFRQHIEGIPVLGPASVAVQVAADGVLDSISVLMRGPTAEVLEKTKVLSPEKAVRQIAQQLTVRYGHTNGDVRLEAVDGLRFGYLNLPKRKSQRLLAPVYLATINVTHEHERQAFVMAVPATEKNYLPLEMPGSESVVGTSNKITGRRCC
jgi:hypothetical protein